MGEGGTVLVFGRQETAQNFRNLYYMNGRDSSGMQGSALPEYG